MEIEVKVPIREIDETETTIDRPYLKLRSHWNNDDRVVIRLPRGKEYTIDADELKTAIERVTGWSSKCAKF